MSSNTSIIIITHNRSNILKKFCEILSAQKFKGNLIICESSQKNYFLKNFKTIKKKNYQFNIQHYSIPKKKDDSISHSMNDSFAKGLKNIKTKYFMMSCDDDIPSIRAINKFESYLDNSKNFDACIGNLVWHSELPKNFFIKFLKKIPYFRIENFFMKKFGINKAYSLTDKLPYDRLNTYFSKYKMFHTMFTFQKKSVAKYLINNNHRKITFNHLSADWHWILAHIISSRITYVPITAIHRFFHGKNLSIKNNSHNRKPTHQHIFQGIISKDWSKNLSNFYNSLKKIRCQHSGKKLSNEHREDILKKYTIYALKFREELNIKDTSFKIRLGKFKKLKQTILWNYKYLFKINKKDYDEYALFQKIFFDRF